MSPAVTTFPLRAESAQLEHPGCEPWVCCEHSPPGHTSGAFLLLILQVSLRYSDSGWRSPPKGLLVIRFLLSVSATPQVQCENRFCLEIASALTFCSCFLLCVIVKASEGGDGGFCSLGRDRLREQVKGGWWVTASPLGSLKTL